MTTRGRFLLHANEMGEVHQIILQRGVAEARKAASNDKADRLCVDAAYEVLSDEAGRIGIVHAGFAMTALPHKRISEAVWERDSDRVKLLVESGLDIKKQPIGVPYGSIARMILLYLQTQAVRTRSREVELGTSMNAWLTAMGIPVGGKTYQIVREQSRRISRCRLTFFRRVRERRDRDERRVRAGCNPPAKPRRTGTTPALAGTCAAG